MRNSKGFTLVEMIVVMAVFIVILMITGDSFKTILQQSGKLLRSEESNIEGVIGLEMLRHDLQQGGYGLFTHDSPVSYVEAVSDLPKAYNNVPGSTASTETPPKPFSFGNNLASVVDGTHTLVANTDYIAIRASTVGRSNSSQKWGFLDYASGSVIPHSWPSTSENFVVNEKVLVMERVSSTKGLRIIPESANNWFYFPYSNTAFNSTSFINYSTMVSSSFVMYGLDDATSIPRMPFNRSDYFVAVPENLPSVCAPGTGVLNKTIVNNSTDTTVGGKLSYFPVLDCVLDLQVVLGWDLFNGSSPGTDGNIDVWTNADATKGATADSSAQYATGSTALDEALAAFSDPARLRNSLKLIKVYILAQNGRKDPAYTSPGTITVGNTKYDGTDPQGLGRSYVLPTNLLNYRWKVYEVVAKPKNLTTNQ